MPGRPARRSRSGHDQQLHLVAPAGNSAATIDAKPERNACLRHQAGPGHAPIGSGRSGQSHPDARPMRMKTSRATASPSAASPITASASSAAKRRLRRRTRRAPAARLADGGTERIALCDREVLDHHPAASAASSGSNCCVLPTWVRSAQTKAAPARLPVRCIAGTARTARRSSTPNATAPPISQANRRALDPPTGAGRRARPAPPASTRRTAPARRDRRGPPSPSTASLRRPRAPDLATHRGRHRRRERRRSSP